MTTPNDGSGSKQASNKKKNTTESPPDAAPPSPPPPPQAASPPTWQAVSPPAAAEGGIPTGGGAEGVCAIPVDISNTRPLKRKMAEVYVPPGTELICAVCKREFFNIKALFGHMRTHPERTWRGFKPPSDNEEPVAARPALSIDLNKRPGTEESSSVDGAEGKKEIDLNKPPTPLEGDDNAQN